MVESGSEIREVLSRIQARGDEDAAFSMAEGKVLVDDLMQLSELTEREVADSLKEARSLCDSPQDVRDLIAAAGIAFAPLILIVQIGGGFLLSCLSAAHGPASAFRWLGCASLVWCAIVFVALRHRQQLAQESPNDQSPSLFARVKVYAERLKREARLYHEPTRRAAFCQKPWLAAVSVLGLETSIAAAAGCLAAFLQAVSVTVFFAVTSGMVLGMAVHETVPGPPEPTRLEMAAAMIARCPFVSTFVSSLCGFLPRTCATWARTSWRWPISMSLKPNTCGSSCTDAAARY